MDAGAETKPKKGEKNEVPASECRCLVRAVGGKRKISALIAAKDSRRFMQSYGNIMKVGAPRLAARLSAPPAAPPSHARA